MAQIGNSDQKAVKAIDRIGQILNVKPELLKDDPETVATYYAELERLNFVWVEDKQEWAELPPPQLPTFKFTMTVDPDHAEQMAQAIGAGLEAMGYTVVSCAVAYMAGNDDAAYVLVEVEQ